MEKELSQKSLNEIKNAFQLVFAFYVALLRQWQRRNSKSIEPVISVCCEGADGEEFTICARTRPREDYADIFIFKGKRDLESLSSEQKAAADIFEDTGNDMYRYRVRTPTGIPANVFVNGMKLLAWQVFQEARMLLNEVSIVIQKL